MVNALSNPGLLVCDENELRVIMHTACTKHAQSHHAEPIVVSTPPTRIRPHFLVVHVRVRVVRRHIDNGDILVRLRGGRC